MGPIGPTSPLSPLLPFVIKLTNKSVSSNVKGFIKVTNQTSTDKFIVYNISDLSDNTGYWELTVTKQTSSQSFSLLDDTALTVSIKLVIAIELSSVEFIYIFVDVNKEF